MLRNDGSQRFSHQYPLARIHDNVESIRRTNNDLLYYFDQFKLYQRKEHLDMMQGLQQNVYEEVNVACKHCWKKKFDLLGTRSINGTNERWVSITLPGNSQIRKRRY